MDNNTSEFLKDLKEFMEKHKVCFSFNFDGDTHCICNEKIIIESYTEKIEIHSDTNSSSFDYTDIQNKKQYKIIKK